MMVGTKRVINCAREWLIRGKIEIVHEGSVAVVGGLCG